MIPSFLNQWKHFFVESLDNPQVKKAMRLREKRSRNQEHRFLIEGYREIQRSTLACFSIESLFVCPDLFLGSNEAHLIQSISLTGCRIIPCSEKVFRHLSYRDRPDGLLAIAPSLDVRFEKIHSTILSSQNPLIIIAESIEKPGNLGTILRCADAVKATAVIICDRCTDIHNPNVVRSSVGTLFTVPICEAKGTEVLEWLCKNKIQILAATPSATLNYTETDMTQPIAIALGTEQVGLSPLWIDNATHKIKIPMQGSADSLNVAMAATILLFEAQRQRGI